MILKLNELEVQFISPKKHFVSNSSIANRRCMKGFCRRLNFRKIVPPMMSVLLTIAIFSLHICFDYSPYLSDAAAIGLSFTLGQVILFLSLLAARKCCRKELESYEGHMILGSL